MNPFDVHNQRVTILKNLSFIHIPCKAKYTGWISTNVCVCLNSHTKTEGALLKPGGFVRVDRICIGANKKREKNCFCFKSKFHRLCSPLFMYNHEWPTITQQPVSCQVK